MNVLLMQLNSLVYTLQLALRSVFAIEGLGSKEELHELLMETTELIMECVKNKEDESLKIIALDKYLEGCDYLVDLRRRCIEFYTDMQQKANSIYEFFDANPQTKEIYHTYKWDEPHLVLDLFSEVKKVAEYVVELESLYCLLQVYSVQNGGFESAQQYYELLESEGSLPIEKTSPSKKSTKIVNLTVVKNKDLH